METPGEMIRRYRHAAGLTQGEVQISLGVSASIISKWETDEVKPNRVNAEKIDRLLKARGEIVAICGFGGNEEITQLAVEVADHGRQLLDLDQRLTALEQRQRNGGRHAL